MAPRIERNFAATPAAVQSDTGLKTTMAANESILKSTEQAVSTFRDVLMVENQKREKMQELYMQEGDLLAKLRGEGEMGNGVRNLKDSLMSEGVQLMKDITKAPYNPNYNAAFQNWRQKVNNSLATYQATNESIASWADTLAKGNYDAFDPDNQNALIEAGKWDKAWRDGAYKIGPDGLTVYKDGKALGDIYTLARRAHPPMSKHEDHEKMRLEITKAGYSKLAADVKSILARGGSKDISSLYVNSAGILAATSANLTQMSASKGYRNWMYRRVEGLDPKYKQGIEDFKGTQDQMDYLVAKAVTMADAPETEKADYWHRPEHAPHYPSTYEQKKYDDFWGAVKTYEKVYHYNDFSGINFKGAPLNNMEITNIAPSRKKNTALISGRISYEDYSINGFRGKIGTVITVAIPYNDPRFTALVFNGRQDADPADVQQYLAQNKLDLFTNYHNADATRAGYIYDQYTTEADGSPKAKGFERAITEAGIKGIQVREVYVTGHPDQIIPYKVWVRKDGTSHGIVLDLRDPSDKITFMDIINGGPGTVVNKAAENGKGNNQWF